MKIHYYLSVFPLEGLISSQLEPEQFGAYMATGSKKGAFEIIMFFEIEGGFGNYFDWQYAEKKCMPHANGQPKNSLYLSVYRSLENTPLSHFRSLYLTTRDGRALELERSEFGNENNQIDFFMYQELCPVRPLVVSALNPIDFSKYLTDPAIKTSIPKIVFSDLKVIDLSDPVNTGHVGRAYDRNLDHLKDCILAVTEFRDKPNKVVDRSHIERFSYQVINNGVYVGDGQELLMYKMKSEDELRRNHYDWARSALIL